MRDASLTVLAVAAVVGVSMLHYRWGYEAGYNYSKTQDSLKDIADCMRVVAKLMEGEKK